MPPCYSWVQRTCRPASLAAGGLTKVAPHSGPQLPLLPLPNQAPHVDRGCEARVHFPRQVFTEELREAPDPRAEGPKAHAAWRWWGSPSQVEAALWTQLPC